MLFSCETADESTNLDQVPAAVKKAFDRDFTSTTVEWEAGIDGTYEAAFMMGWQRVVSNYSATGELLETEVEIKKTDLPNAVRTSVAEQYPDHSIEEAARIIYHDQRVIYEAELKGKDDKRFDALFSSDGTLRELIELQE